MYQLNNTEQMLVSGGCQTGDCKAATIELLLNCDLTQLFQVNATFKSVIMSEEMQGVDSATLKTALINAILNADF